MQKHSVLPSLDPSSLPAGTQGFVCTDGRVLPLYKALPNDTKQGMYFALVNGRKDPSVVLLGEGFAGPVFGPLRNVKGDDDELVLEFVNADLGGVFLPDMEKRPGPDGALKPTGEAKFLIEDGLIEFDGQFFAAHITFVHPVPK